MAVAPGAQSATVSRVPTSTVVATLFAATGGSANRLIYNESGAVLYVKFGSTATSTDYTVAIGASGYYELPEPTYSGIVTGILSAGTGNAQCTSYA